MVRCGAVRCGAVLNFLFLILVLINILIKNGSTTISDHWYFVHCIGQVVSNPLHSFLKSDSPNQ